MLNETIKSLRKAKGLTQEEFAAKLNVVRQTVSKWESGLSVPDAEMLLKIADALGTTVGVLLGGAAPTPEEPEPSIHAIAARLELLNEQLARHSERNRRIWRAVFTAIGVLSLICLVREGLQFFHLRQAGKALESSASIIGGTDAPTSILVSAPGISVLIPVFAGVAAIFGIYHTRQK